MGDGARWIWNLWGKHRRDELEVGNLDAILAALEPCRKTNTEAQTCREYIRANRHRMAISAVPPSRSVHVNGGGRGRMQARSRHTFEVSRYEPVCIGRWMAPMRSSLFAAPNSVIASMITVDATVWPLDSFHNILVRPFPHHSSLSTRSAMRRNHSTAERMWTMSFSPFRFHISSRNWPA